MQGCPTYGKIRFIWIFYTYFYQWKKVFLVDSAKCLKSQERAIVLRSTNRHVSKQAAIYLGKERCVIMN